HLLFDCDYSKAVVFDQWFLVAAVAFFLVAHSAGFLKVLGCERWKVLRLKSRWGSFDGHASLPSCGGGIGQRCSTFVSLDFFASLWIPASVVLLGEVFVSWIVFDS
ncbi:hypothetical protein Dimus_014040, partial [Dionaea muscipula]